MVAETHPLFGRLLSAKSFTGTLWPPSNAVSATSRKAKEDSQRERLKMMLTRLRPPATASAPNITLRRMSTS